MEAATADAEAVEEAEVVDETEEEDTLPKSDEDAPQLSLFPGGPDPTKSILSLKASKKEISNELERGQEVALLVHARVEEVHFNADTRKHVLAVLDIFEHDPSDPGMQAQQALPDAVGDESPFPPEEVLDEEPSAEADAGGDVTWD